MKESTFNFTSKSQVFWAKYEGNFATPKKINRSNKSLSDTFIDKVEDGIIESDDIDIIEKSFPVFVYKTCITIHGNLPSIERQRVGVYKNIRQNKNGSLELLYRAIDHNQKTLIGRYLRFSDSNWKRCENSSNGIFYQCTQRFDKKSEALEYMKSEKEKMDNLNLEGVICRKIVEGYVYFGLFYIISSIYPLTISKKSKAVELAAAISGAEISTILAAEKEYNDKQIKDNENRQRLIDTNNAELEKLEKELRVFQHVGNSQLIPGKVYCHLVLTTAGYVYKNFKIVKGSFGKVEVHYKNSRTIGDIEGLKVYPKQVKPSEITGKNIYLLK